MDLYDLYSSVSIIQVIKSGKLRWTGHGAYGGRERCIQDFGGETRGETPLGRSKHKWDDKQSDREA